MIYKNFFLLSWILTTAKYCQVCPGDVEGVYCTDVMELCDKVCDAWEQNFDDIPLVKLGVDGGQGSLKVGMSLITEDDLLPGACHFKKVIFAKIFR